MNRNDPENLPTGYNPAIVRLIDGEELLVANQTTQDAGWLYVVGWTGRRRKFPSHRVAYVESVETERRGGPGTDRRRHQAIVDEELVAEIRERLAEIDEGGEPPEVPA